ncbi:DivIVA domain-containing protein [Nocardia yunnanensis]|uniref:Cell wall synthesis protein Wag31 n=1 Tax=Nocardia yunnanensis TaxID=2382165 RepID=A0A386ZQD8_9NOCA|nr:DivIVA domain-containing protein [Nocardia yunnanensis]AYF78929.1 DivIVA domain-containing protein [Nocardia yunnanensis]
MTPDDVRRTRFGPAPLGHHGYHPGQVDALCGRIADTMLGRDHLTVAEIRLAEFDTPPAGQRGYEIEQVDDFLDHMCVELEELRHGRGRLPARHGHGPLTHDDVLRIQFSPPPYGFPGYLASEVGALLDRLAATLAHHGPNGLTAQDIRDVTFHLAPAGEAACHRDEVDAFLDLVAVQLEKAEVGRH